MAPSRLRLTRLISEKTALYIILILSLLGIFFSSFLLYTKYNPNEFCPADGLFDCDKVGQSEWSEILGIPVSLIGLIGFALILVLSFIRLVRPTKSNEMFTTIIFLLSIIGAGFGIYLTCIEIFILEAICPYCLVSFILGIIILVVMTILFLGLRKEPPAPEEGDDDTEDADDG